MRKTYPYLQNVYAPDLNDESAKRRFLSYIDDFVNQRQYVKITLLDWEENPIKEIQGEISSGTISKDGSSSVRRTGNLSCAVDGNSYNVDDMEMDFSLSKKVFIEIGIKNDSPYYTEYPILWFPQGVFFITSFSMNSSTTSAVNLSIGLKDKMAMLNGDVGGKLPAIVRFDSMETQVSEGEWVEQKVLIYYIIQELVNHYGGEDLNNIIIEDVPLRIRKIMQWGGENPLYGKLTPGGGELAPAMDQWEFSLTKREGFEYTYEYGADVGYIYSDFVVTEELYSNAGDSVCTILDKLKAMLGNYEYFYDEMGIFHFREIKNFLNVTQAEFLLDQSSENHYLIETTNEKNVFAFEDNRNITSINVSPKYDNIKNEYIVHGLRPGTTDNEAANVMYHLVIDSKPEPANTLYLNKYLWYGIQNDNKEFEPFHDLVLYTDAIDGLNKLAKWKEVDRLPDVGNFNLMYYNDGKFYYWDNTVYKEAVYIQEDDQEVSPIKYDDYYPIDWRTFLYIKGLEAQIHGTDEEIYFEELAAFWPREYNLKLDKQGFYTTAGGAQTMDETPEQQYLLYSQGLYFLDFIDTAAELGKYSVSAIGRRSVVVKDDKINCLVEPEIPNVIFLNIDNPADNASDNTVINDDEMSESESLEKQREICEANGHPYTQVHEDIYSNLLIGGYKNSAYERIRYKLFCHTNFQRTVSITALPAFYLEPNSRVSLSDRSTNTYGDYMVQNISLTLGPGANMAVTLNEVHERL